MREQVEKFMRRFQDDLCQALETCDGKATFQEDLWQHHTGGGGRTRVIQKGNVFEKGGVNFSAVTGSLSEKAAQSLLLPDPNYFATGVSVVIHPENPMVPITHMNVRYFEAGNGDAWFGGGIDLTPIYVNKAQGKFFHEQLKNVCDKHHASYYPEFKKWADDYFYITHRQETRGIGGTFCDRLMANENFSIQDRFNFIQDLAYTFAPTYTKIVNENRELPYTEREKQWQMLRRGRYVEFNLAIDRGTKFGLETSGRIESILMSLPNLAGWEYNFQTEPGSPEAETQSLLKKEIDWLNVV
ncbi:oxygen-dependent coproporphyrinogen oxidase [Adhaeribacter sp. BT258]|uniref:coproporphyrinogen oxidase n=1 Tax=Adhaeribacter terrigena TaxID=2793070 RepID=A0ABS1C0R7_9BACT|nr:oxygen-dependent coproporphyrinogen oxidase [Adhaeribacter terrigena]MBK0402930.1 oxygen-dependent coproporphyrinogen oxidase [Adhaeribacter terrigena]